MGKTISSIVVGLGFGFLNGLLTVIHGFLPFGACLICLFAPLQILLFFFTGLLAVRKNASDIRNIFSAITTGAVAGLVAGIIWAFISFVASIAAGYTGLPYSTLFSFGGTDAVSLIVRAIVTLLVGLIGGLILGLLGGFVYASLKLKL